MYCKRPRRMIDMNAEEDLDTIRFQARPSIVLKSASFAFVGTQLYSHQSWKAYLFCALRTSFNQIRYNFAIFQHGDYALVHLNCSSFRWLLFIYVPGLCEGEYCTTVSAASTDPSVWNGPGLWNAMVHIMSPPLSRQLSAPI
jgi:hypothetical protein